MISLRLGSKLLKGQLTQVTNVLSYFLWSVAMQLGLALFVQVSRLTIWTKVCGQPCASRALLSNISV